MKVSVVIPAYNEEKYIEKCLKSIVEQEEMPNEIIIVDNNSTDKTIAISQKYPVKIIYEKKQGIIPARNAGFNAATNEIIARTDADSTVSPNWIKEIKTTFKKHEIDALTGPAIITGIPFNTIIYIKAYFKILKKIQGHHTMIGPNFAITKNIWNKVKDKICQDDKKVHEDIDLAININNCNGKIFYNPNLIVKISGRRILKKPESFFIEYPLRLIDTLQKYFVISKSSNK